MALEDLCRCTKSPKCFFAVLKTYFFFFFYKWQKNIRKNIYFSKGLGVEILRQGYLWRNQVPVGFQVDRILLNWIVFLLENWMGKNDDLFF